MPCGGGSAPLNGRLSPLGSVPSRTSSRYGPRSPGTPLGSEVSRSRGWMIPWGEILILISIPLMRFPISCARFSIRASPTVGCRSRRAPPPGPLSRGRFRYRKAQNGQNAGNFGQSAVDLLDSEHREAPARRITTRRQAGASRDGERGSCPALLFYRFRFERRRSTRCVPPQVSSPEATRPRALLNVNMPPETSPSTNPRRRISPTSGVQPSPFP